MPWATKSTKGPSTSTMADTADEVKQDETSFHEESEPEQETFIHQSLPQVQQQVYPSMYMPYIEGPSMDWTVNNTLYHRFLKWKLKCENILACKLAALPECHKCKKVIAWSTLEWINTSHGVVQRRDESWHNLGEVWRFLQATIKQSNSTVWSCNRFSPRQ